MSSDPSELIHWVRHFLPLVSKKHWLPLASVGRFLVYNSTEILFKGNTPQTIANQGLFEQFATLVVASAYPLCVSKPGL